MIFPRMKRFGPHGPPDVEQAPTPVGQVCTHCQEPFVEGDSGPILPALLVNASTGETMEGPSLPFHGACFLRGIVGSVGHQLGKCGCSEKHEGEPEDDPPGMTKRQAAEAAVALFGQMQHGPLN